MYYIKLEYKSHKKGIYIKVEKTAINEEQAKKKELKLYKRWIKILYPELEANEINDVLILDCLIQYKLDVLNEYEPGEQKRSFTLTYSYL